MQHGRFALAFIFLTMLLDTMGLGIIIPVSPGIIAELTHQNLSGAARWGSWLFFVFAAMQFLCAPLIGNLSDRFGRRPVLILSLVMLAIDYAITGLAPTIGWLFIGRSLSGMAGATYPTVNAYIADVSPPEKRAANFGLVGAAFGLGFILGPALGGFVGQYFGLRSPFFPGRRTVAGQCAVRLCRTEGIAAGGAAAQIRALAGQSAGFAGGAETLSRPDGTVRCAGFHQAGA